ncbi:MULTISPECIES: glycosyltransferase family 4 protein [Sulfolobaceae]|uniref:glycosyltransferase family 4 protein n=1 Tax=Sulfolobaceae TaxID=118883 RepID=UPI00163D5079|nr:MULTISPECIES: glycosyltransferase family 4 protein [unclassified Sulfolobus]
MRVLIVTYGDVRDPKGGYLIRVSNLIKCIKEEDLKVIQFITEGRGKEKPIKKSDENIVTIRASKNYFFLGLSLLFNAIKFSYLIKRSDVVIFEGSLFLPFGLMGRLLGKKVIHDFHGSIVEVSRGLRGVKNFVLRKMIGGTLDKLAVIIANLTIAVSDRDAELVKRIWKRAKVMTVVHGIDVDRIPFFEVKRDKIEKLIFAGNLYAVNNLATVENLIEVAKDLPCLEFLIVGDGKELVKGPPPNVKLMGKVDSLDPYYEEADACIIPITSGTGVKTKVLECMAYGRPVITTEKGIEGIEEARSLKGVYVVRLEEMSKVIKEMKLERAYLELRSFVKDNFSVSVTCRQLRKALEFI